MMISMSGFLLNNSWTLWTIIGLKRIINLTSFAYMLYFVLKIGVEVFCWKSIESPKNLG